VVADISQEAQHPTRLEDRQLVGQTARRKPDIPPLDGQMSRNKPDTALADDNFKESNYPARRQIPHRKEDIPLMDRQLTGNRTSS
jgi:hypothetical protein